MEKYGWSKIRAMKGFLLSQSSRLFRNSTKTLENATGSVPAPENPRETPSEVCFNHEAYALISRRMHEVEAQKAMTILESRHERWKGAGGSV